MSMKKEEAIEVVRKNLPHLGIGATEMTEALETLIPELAESDDERIRKELVNFILYKAGHLLDEDTEHKFVAYLEKQKEREIIIPERKLTDFEIEVHEIIAQARCDKRLADEDVLKQFEQEAACALMLKAEKQKEQKPEHFELKAGKWYLCHRAYSCRADHLTVKEGERFMCEKDGVVKGFVIKEPEKYFKECSAPAPMEDEQKEQKPVKLNDDIEVGLDRALQIVMAAKGNLCGYQSDDGIYECDHAIQTLEYVLKDGIELKPAEWSEEDEKMLNKAIEFTTESGWVRDKEKCLSWLKSLRPQPQGTYKKVIQTIFGMLKDKDFYDIQPSHRVSLLNKIRLKCKDAIECVPILDEPHWKPSEEQMKELLNALIPGKDFDCDILAELYSDLKKL